MRRACSALAKTPQDCFDKEEKVEEVWHLSSYTVRHGEDWQSLDAEEHDWDERYDDRQNSDREGGSRRFRVLEQHPESPQRRVGRQMYHLRRVAFRSLILVDDVGLELVEEQFVEEHVVWNVWRSTKSAAVLVIQEDRLEAGPVSVEEELVFCAVEELRSLTTVAKQSVWMTFKHHESRLEVLTTHVNPESSALFHFCGRRSGQPGSHINIY